jgi:hypothetical protein
MQPHTSAVTVASLSLDQCQNPFNATAEELVASALEKAAVTSPLTTINGIEIARLVDAYTDKRQRFQESTRLGHLLLEKGLLTEENLNNALMVQQQEAIHMARPVRPLGQILVSMHLCTELDIARTLGEQDARRVEEANRYQKKPFMSKYPGFGRLWQHVGNIVKTVVSQRYSMNKFN